MPLFNRSSNSGFSDGQRKGLFSPMSARTRTSEITYEMIACPADGKSVLKWAMNLAMNSCWLPSGLQIDVANPKAVAELLRNERLTRHLMEKDVLPRTQTTDSEEYELSLGEQRLLTIRTQEVIGQVLTNTRPDSPKDMQERYQEYVDRLGRADCLWVMVPCIPGTGTARERDRFRVKLRLCSSYVKEALKKRSGGKPVSVAIILSKLDSRFDNADSARGALDDQILKQELMPLVNLVVQSQAVGSAAIFPISSYGFGTAEPHHGSSVEPDLDVDTACDEDHHWILRKDALIEPYNITGLMIWSLLNSLAPREINERQPEDQVLINLIRKLNEDLKELDPWLVALKSSFPSSR